MDEKFRELNKLYIKLKYSMAIQDLWPEAFKHGQVSSYLKGNLFNPDKIVLIIENNHEQKEFKLKDIPEILFKRQVFLNYRKVNNHQKELWQKVINYYEGRV